MTVVVIVAGVALWFVLSAAHRFVQKAEWSSATQTRIRVLLPGATFLVWTAYALWAIETAFSGQTFHAFLQGGVLLALAGIIAWFLLRDLIAGIVFRTQHPNILSHHLSVGDVKGKVVGLGSTRLQLQSASGEQLSFPYSKIVGAPITEYSRGRTTDRFHVALSVDPSENPETLAAMLKRELLLIPWVNSHIPPAIKCTSEDGRRTAHVAFHCLSETHASAIEERLRVAAAKQRQVSSR